MHFEELWHTSTGASAVAFVFFDEIVKQIFSGVKLFSSLV